MIEDSSDAQARKRQKLNSEQQGHPKQRRAKRQGRNLVLGSWLPSQLAGVPRSRFQSSIRDALAYRTAGSICEEEFPVEDYHCDKAFACTWLDDQQVLVGTKDNQLLKVDIYSKKATPVPLPPEPARRRGAAPQDDPKGCGIHCIAVNPSRDLVATGGDCPNDCAVLKLPSFEPVQTMVGHKDWVFGVAWITERVLVTGSRDRSLKVWNIRGTAAANKRAMKNAPRAHKYKVRDVKFCQQTELLASVGPDQSVKLWTPQLQELREVMLEGEKELVCLAMQPNFLAAGSADAVALMDPRSRSDSVRRLQFPSRNQGVRALEFSDHLLAIGTGQGCICFYDIRASKYLPLHDYNQTASLHSERGWEWLQTGAGWLSENEVYREHFANMSCPNACYGLCWDATRTSLLACGGPLATGLTGCYMALWR